MPNVYEVFITETAFNDLADIAFYVADSLQEPDISKKLIEKIKEGIFSLENLPNRNNLVNDKYLASKGYRKLSVENYLVFYIVSDDENIVYVSRVLYAKRNWVDLL